MKSVLVPLLWYAAFVRSYRRSRALMAEYVPSRLDGADLRKVLLHPLGAVHADGPLESEKIALPGCDHFTIVSSPA